MLVGRQGAGELVQERAHRRCRDLGQDEAHVLAGSRLDGGVDIGPVEAPVAQPAWAPALEPPAMPCRPFCPTLASSMNHKETCRSGWAWATSAMTLASPLY